MQVIKELFTVCVGQSVIRSRCQIIIEFRLDKVNL